MESPVKYAAYTIKGIGSYMSITGIITRNGAAMRVVGIF